jgi:FtsZ-binding cell division protein ZapB
MTTFYTGLFSQASSLPEAPCFSTTLDLQLKYRDGPIVLDIINTMSMLQLDVNNLEETIEDWERKYKQLDKKFDDLCDDNKKLEQDLDRLRDENYELEKDSPDRDVWADSFAIDMGIGL